MRFRPKLVVPLLLLSFTPPLLAEEQAFVLKPTHRLLDLPEPTEPTPLFIYADQIEGAQDKQIEATGHVEMRKLGQRVWADYLLYLQQSQDMHAIGAVRLEQNNNTLLGPELKLNLESNVGDMPQPKYILGATNGHGAADTLHIASRENYTLKNASYTTCPSNQEDWQLKAGSLNIDQNTQIGEATDVTVSWMGIPFLYSPWMDFALNNQRKSGFLGPVFGTTTKGGSEFTLPFYWNIAPNMDATLAPRIMSKRGVLLNNEFRYLEPGYSGQVDLDVLPRDALTNTSRSRFSLKHQHALAPGWAGNIIYNQVSDNAYYRDMSGTVNTATQLYLPRQASLLYSGGGWWHAMLNLQRFQVLQDPAARIASPYSRAPQLILNAAPPIESGSAKFTGEFVEFTHPTSVNGSRLLLYPSISYPLVTNPGFFVTPKLSWHNTFYSLGANNNTQLPANASRSIPMFSLDSGMAFERDTELSGQEFLQTLEPRAYYVYIPYQDQGKLPIFDTGQAGFGLAQIFSENRFVGNDRIGDANQVTAALTSRLIEKDGGDEWMRFILAQRFSAITPQVNMAIPTATTNKSDILAGFSARINRTWSADSFIQYNPIKSQDELFNASAKYQPEPGKVLNIGYRFMRNTLNLKNNIINHISASAQWPLYGRWDAVARANYLLQGNRLVEGLFGLEYNQDCWTARIVAQRFAIATQQTSTGIFLQLELNGLVRVGSDPLTALRQGIPGYTKMNQRTDDAPLPNLYD